MSVLRIVADLATQDVAALHAFYGDLFDLDVLMDQGWIVTLGTQTTGPVQLNIVSEGGNGAPVPELSIEVDDVDAVHARAVNMGTRIVLTLRDEPWGVRRFFVVDPEGRRVNIMMHL